MDAGAIQEHLELLQFDLAAATGNEGPKGILGCGYINVETCNKTGEVCAIVTGVNTFDDMRKAKVVATSNKAVELGIQVGESGQDALNKMR
jgi:uncharacterized protein YunC (DUF1805 family)